MKVAYARGLHELGDGLFAYLQPDGSWGWSNAGLITGSGTSLLIDTLFDLRLTREMLERMRPVTANQPIQQAMNTHGNGDHWYGNDLLPDGIPIVATQNALEEMQALPPSTFHALTSAELEPELARFVHHAFGRFDFSGIEGRLPSVSFTDRHELRVGERPVSLIELGPAHTAGDAIAHVADAGVVFTGDLLFIEATPIMWAGPVANWLNACERILELDAAVLVPGHGPVTDASGVRDVQRYLRYVRDEAQARFDAGLDAEAASDDIDLSDFRDWGDPERLAVNVATIYRDLDPAAPAANPVELIARMARWRARH
ncbi:MAG TPA: MBL fold metallo-hydrolase [Solirubrobacteraceae bacterium]|jgi:glyoxylase-like metal-dependent hydrolase (beta-lactamase superfamily II)|nr:MBL fold metallo-hydrolase [Solirubrobacteraceae bacterium]